MSTQELVRLTRYLALSSDQAFISTTGCLPRCDTDIFELHPQYSREDDRIEHNVIQVSCFSLNQNGISLMLRYQTLNYVHSCHSSSQLLSISKRNRKDIIHNAMISVCMYII
jgi:hypothetical protein